MRLVLVTLSLFNVFVHFAHVTADVSTNSIHVIQSNCVCDNVLLFALFHVFAVSSLTVSFGFHALCHLSSAI